jgi:hypothetical protein
MGNFKLNLFVPSLNSKAQFKEFKNIHLFTVLKYITNKDSIGLAKYFDEILFELIENKQLFYQLNSFDKFILLLQIKSININPELKFKSKAENKETTIAISILDQTRVLTELNLETNKEIYISDNFSVGVSLPSSLFLENYENLITNSISFIKLGDKKYFLAELSEDERNKVLDSITGDNLKKILDFINELNLKTKDIFLLKKTNHFDFNELMLNLFNNSMLYYLEIIFYENLLSFFEFMYVVVNKVKINLTEFFNLVPSEALILYNYYIKDVENQNKELEKISKSGKGPTIGKAP